jgi:hypothetical protein
MNNRDDQNQDSAMPERLRAALLRLNGSEVAVPSQIDEGILHTARQHLDQVAREATTALPRPQSVSEPSSWTAFWDGVSGLFAARRRVMWGGAAVMIVAVGVLVWLGGHPRLTARPEDLNGDGVVDMLDAFALARELQLTPASHPQLDLNGDGVVDEGDVRILAAQAVRLEPGGKS